MRLIDADALLDRLAFKRMASGQRNTYPGLESAISQVKKAATIDAVEVVHGRWVGYEGFTTVGLDKFGREIDKHYRYFQCDKCYKKNVVRSNYCPNCGADMRGKENG